MTRPDRRAVLALLLATVAAAPAMAANAPRRLRVATYDPGLSREGPGLLLRDISRKDPQVMAAVAVIAAARPDVILLTGLDWDADNRALSALAGLLDQAGLRLPHQFAGPPNSGRATGLDLDQDGRLGEADDAQGWGQFTGQNAMALLSRYPIGRVRDYSDQLWRDLPGNLMPAMPPQIAERQRLSSTAHWDIEIVTPVGPLRLLAWAATPPVFDGPDDRNGRRNHDEAAFWLQHLPKHRFVLLGNPNLDIVDGEGRPEALAALIAKAVDPQPRGAWQPPQQGVNASQRGDPSLDTAVYDPSGPGNLRVDYILPSRDLTVLDSGVIWPPPDDPLAADVEAASNHRLVWVDLQLAK